MANRLRRLVLIETSEANSGHPTSCFSAAELASTLFFHYLRFDVDNPADLNNDRFVLSKGHAAPLLWALWAEAGGYREEELKSLRKFESELEGHPTPRSRYVDVATGSLGQGLPIGVGMAFASKLNGTKNRIYVLVGDGELAEGSVWEAFALAEHAGLDNLIAILDINKLGQSQQTMYGHELEIYRRKLDAFGWRTYLVDGHDIRAVAGAFESALAETGKPVAIIARTVKGKGVSFLEGDEHMHGKPVSGEQLKQALAEVGGEEAPAEKLAVKKPEQVIQGVVKKAVLDVDIEPGYGIGQQVATREAFGNALKKLGERSKEVIAIDGDVQNSTYEEKFAQQFRDRFLQAYIAEQVMVGAAVGAGALGKIPFAATFACFLSRAFDFLRMAAISQANIKLCGSHCGVSIGEDGPSQMGLEDLAMMRSVHGAIVFYPSDAVSCERLVAVAARTPGIVYIRTTRPKTSVLYSQEERFEPGGLKVLRQSENDRAAIAAAGITVHEALKAHDRLREQGLLVRVLDVYCLKPIDTAALEKAAAETGAILTVEDHYPEGGLGEAVRSAVCDVAYKFQSLAVRELPRSGAAEQLLAAYKIDAEAIVKAVLQMIG